jgi:Zn-dependent oligopeptidase
MNMQMKKRMLAVLIFGFTVIGMVVHGDFADRALRISAEERPESVEAVSRPTRDTMTSDERIADLERLVDRLYRIIDPPMHRDEMKIERRIVDLEAKVAHLERELRRISSEPRR